MACVILFCFYFIRFKGIYQFIFINIQQQTTVPFDNTFVISSSDQPDNKTISEVSRSL